MHVKYVKRWKHIPNNMRTAIRVIDSHLWCMNKGKVHACSRNTCTFLVNTSKMAVDDVYCNPPIEQQQYQGFLMAAPSWHNGPNGHDEELMTTLSTQEGLEPRTYPIDVFLDLLGCSLESMTQPTWLSTGGLSLCLVFRFLGVYRVKTEKSIFTNLRGTQFLIEVPKCCFSKELTISNSTKSRAANVVPENFHHWA